LLPKVFTKILSSATVFDTGYKNCFLGTTSIY